MGLFDNFTPEARLMMGAGIMGGQTLGQGLSQGAQMAMPMMLANKQQTEATAVENKTRQWLQSQYPGEDFSTMSPDMMKMYANEAFKSRFAKPEGPDYQFIQAGDRLILGNKADGSIKELGNYSKPADLPAIADEYNFAKDQGFKGTFEDYQKYKAGIDDGKTSDRFKTELDTMKTYRGEDAVKTFQATRDAYEKVRSSSQLATAQGDIGLIFGFMKMLDPTSVVREGEFATAQNSGGIDETVYNIYNKALSGQRLTPEQRQKFVEAAQAQYENTAKNLEGVNTRYKGLADEYQVPTERFLEQPKTYEPLNLTPGQKVEKVVNGKKVTIERVSD